MQLATSKHHQTATMPSSTTSSIQDEQQIKESSTSSSSTVVTSLSPGPSLMPTPAPSSPNSSNNSSINNDCATSNNNNNNNIDNDKLNKSTLNQNNELKLVDEDDDEEDEDDDQMVDDDLNEENNNKENEQNSNTNKSKSNIDECYSYWKNFDIKQFQMDLNSQITDIQNYQLAQDELNSKYIEMKNSLNEDVLKSSTVSPLLKQLQAEIDNLSKRCKTSENACVDLFKLLTHLPDPFPVIELIKENRLRKQLETLEEENKVLKESLKNKKDSNTESKQSEEQDKKLIKLLSEQVAKTTSLNLELTAKLKISEGEIQSYKQLIAEFQSELSEMKVKQLSEIKADILKENTNTKDYEALNTADNDFENDDNESPLNASFNTPNITNNTNNSISYEALNTADIAQKVRDLLSLHNIGQRIFAKYILGLSQGTVSELLSKPKHWDKLTEKGRESYRKMYNWSCSEQSINSLKAISPRKGNKDNYFYQSSSLNKEDAPPSTSSNQMVLDERIAKILSEAKNHIQNNQTSKLIYSASSPSGNEEISSQSQRSSTSNSPSMSPSSNQRKHLPVIKREASKDDYYTSDNEKLSNNELLNVSYFKQKNNNCDESDQEEEEEDEDENRSTKRNDESFPLDLTVKTNKNNNNSLIPNMIQMMMMMKKRKLNDTQNDEYESGEEDEDESCKKSTLNMLKQLTNHNSTGNLAASINSSLNSLKHMQSITDSYLLTTAATAAAQNNNNQNKSKIFNINHNTSSSSLNNLTNNKSSLFLQSPNTSSFSRPSSTPSPSLSLNNYNTNSGGGKQLKCVLPPVSQEQFDKYSQINTDDLVRKVKDLLSKFSISQRLFGECILGLSQGSVSDLLARPKPWIMLTQKGREPFIRMQMFIDDPDAIKKLMANQYKTPGNDSNNNNVVKAVVNINNNNTSTKTSNSSSSNNSPNFNEPSNRNNYYQDNSNDSEMKPTQQASFITSSSNSTSNNNNTNQTINIIPYDISALSAVGELNTDDITNKVKETLLNNNIGQKLFGEAVLNLSQGTVSELLSKPKPWNTLSIKGREPYLRMFMWLQDRYKLEKLNEWKEEKNLLKRNNANNNQNNNTHDMNSANGDGNDHQKPKRRFIFSEEQKDQLMQAFKRDPYPAVNQMELLASQLGLQTRTVINWFHNHRMRIRYKNTTNTPSSNSTAISFNGRAGRTPASAALFNQNNDFNNNKFSYSNNNSNNNTNNNDDMNGYEEDEDDEMNQYEMESKSAKHHHDLNQSLDEEDEDESANNNEIDSLYIASNNNEDEDEDDDNNNQKDENDNYMSNQPNNLYYNMINKHLQMLKSFNQIQQFNQQQQQDDKSMMSSSNNKRRKPHNPQKLNLINSQADSSTNSNNNNNNSNNNLPMEIMQKNAF